MSWLRIGFSRGIVLSVQLFARLFYRFEVSWVSPPPPDAWQDLRVFALLNHTSLLEPLFFGAVPTRFLWDGAARAVVPGADITLKRPVIGRFYRYFAPRTIAISRKRDASWDAFMAAIANQSLVAIAPEGRMMRSDGRDKHGKPMSVRGGIADILEALGEGKMMLAYSGGLHHVNRPGEARIRLFQRLAMRFELIDIASYLAGFAELDPSARRLAIARDLEARLAQHKP
ncbi:MAG: 1-acyl-sn-glycerol-3-phosphate acyltransferase [Candidatus Sericytochromatia bacterium]|nr:1-acyl-sn-glycerol-3-phosphate acyltransferase [Candidatus Sericytochromatia bacterium]